MASISVTGTASVEPPMPGSNLSGCIQIILPEKNQMLVPQADEILCCLNRDRSVVAVGRSGSGRTTCCKVALKRFAGPSFQIMRPPQNEEMPALMAWVAGLRAPIALLLSEKLESRGERDFQAIHQVLSHGRDWLKAEHLRVVVAVLPQSYDRLRKSNTLDCLVPWDAVEVPGFDRQTARDYLGRLLGNDLMARHHSAIEGALSRWSNGNYVRPIDLTGLYSHLKDGAPSGDIPDEIRDYPSVGLMERLSATERTVWLARDAIERLCRICPEQALRYMARRHGVEDPKRVIHGLAANGLFRLEPHAVHEITCDIHDLHRGAGKLYREKLPHVHHDVVDDLVYFMEYRAQRARRTIQERGEITASELRRFISACHTVFAATRRPTRLRRLLCSEGEAYPPLMKPRSMVAETKLAAAIEGVYSALLRTLSAEENLDVFAGLCEELDDYGGFYLHMKGQGLKLERQTANILHESGQFQSRWLVEKKVQDSPHPAARRIQSIVTTRLAESGACYEACARSLDEVAPFMAGMYWRSAAWDYMRIDRHRDAHRCFTQAANRFLADDRLHLLAAECYRGWGQAQYTHAGEGLRNLFKALHLRCAGQMGMTLVDWQERILSVVREPDQKALDREWTAALTELRNRLGTDFAGAGERPCLQRLAPEPAWQTCDPGRPTALVLGDFGDEYLIDFVRTFLLKKYGLPSRWLCPYDLDPRMLSKKELTPQRPDLVIMIGGTKVPGMTAVQQVLLPSPKNLALLLAPQEQHRSFLWCRKPTDAKPMVVWAASGGLDGTYEAVWHMVRHRWTGLDHYAQLPEADGEELPHLFTMDPIQEQHVAEIVHQNGVKVLAARRSSIDGRRPPSHMRRRGNATNPALSRGSDLPYEDTKGIINVFSGQAESAHPNVVSRVSDVECRDGTVMDNLTNPAVVQQNEIDAATLKHLYAEFGNLLQKGPGRAEHCSDCPGKEFCQANSCLILRAEATADVRNTIKTFGPTDHAVLIRGETGTGKELVADALHHRSERAKDEFPFIKVSLAGLSPTLIESELFGHVNGAFTGATKDRTGHFKAAHTGTIFLDEIGDMPLDKQAVLLRVLQQGEVIPVGSDKAEPVNVRVISATRQNIEQMAATGAFRTDLFYRICTAQVYVPPLRERLEDFPCLLGHFLGRKPSTDRQSKGMTRPAFEAILQYSWPGNIRQLESVVRYARTVARDASTIGLKHLPQEFSQELSCGEPEHDPSYGPPPIRFYQEKFLDGARSVDKTTCRCYFNHVTTSFQDSAKTLEAARFLTAVSEVFPEFLTQRGQRWLPKASGRKGTPSYKQAIADRFFDGDDGISQATRLKRVQQLCRACDIRIGKPPSRG